jgi:glutamate 5-kinase
LLQLGVVPIINENDSVGTQEIRFGDNDRLAALVALLIGADLLVLVSDIDALYDAPPTQAGAQRIHEVSAVADIEGITLGGAGSAGVGSGGMVTKVEAARIATSAGIQINHLLEKNSEHIFMHMQVKQLHVCCGWHMQQSHKAS